MAPIVSLHDELVSAGHQRQSIAVIERLGDILTERVARATGGYSPSASAIYIILLGPGSKSFGTWALPKMDIFGSAQVWKFGIQEYLHNSLITKYS